MAIIGIVAVDRQGAIGKGGGLPWHYPADLKFFKRQTTGHACVMGYKTWLTLKRPLPNRLNIVLSHASDIEPRESVLLLRDRLQVLSLAAYLACDLYVIGGAQVFKEFAADIDRWVVTRVPVTVEGADTFMPENFLDDFEARDTRSLEGDLPEGVLEVTFYDRARRSS